MIWTFLLKNWKWAALFLVVIGGSAYVWKLRKDNIALNKENFRLSENAQSIRTKNKNDSVKYSSVILTQEEFLEDMRYNHAEQLKSIESKLDINAKQISRLQTVKNVYITKDTTSYILNEILKGIQENKPVSQKVVDSTECHLVEAMIHFNGKEVSLDITKVGYTSITEIVAFMENRKWYKFWKWFKKRKVTVSVLNKCGKTTTRLVDVQK